jgi:myo-inositol-1(or 4)-monophosphatase
MPTSDIFQHAKTLHPELATAITAAAAAGQIIVDGVDQLHEFDQKGVGDLVSEIDRRADAAISDVLKSHSDAAILSEELNPENDAHDEMWIVDPLDGTSAYLMQVGNQYPAVLIAKWKNEKTQLGVAYFPLTGEWFYAVAGQGAWKNGDPLRTHTATPATLQNSWVEMNQYGDSSLETETFAALRTRLRSHGGASLVTTTVPNSGVAIRIAESKAGLVAAIHDNRADNVKQAPWDIAAPQLILQEAGGVFLNLDGQPSNPFVAEVIVVARSKNVAEQIIELVKPEASCL